MKKIKESKYIRERERDMVRSRERDMVRLHKRRGTFAEKDMIR